MDSCTHCNTRAKFIQSCKPLRQEAEGERSVKLTLKEFFPSKASETDGTAKNISLAMSVVRTSVRHEHFRVRSKNGVRALRSFNTAPMDNLFIYSSPYEYINHAAPMLPLD